MMLWRKLNCSFNGSYNKIFSNNRFVSTRNGINKMIDNSLKNYLKIALVGRPNVGKSTLFNRLTKSRSAIVNDIEGTTRDRKIGKGAMAGIEYEVIDTGGMEETKNGSLEEKMLLQTRKAIHEADMIFFIIDARNGMTSIDEHFARWLRRSDPIAPMYVIANKVEGYPHNFSDNVNDCYKLGFGTPIPISAEHGEGISQLLDYIIPIADKKEKLIKQKEENIMLSEENNEKNNKLDPIRLAIVGRPNVGKSTFLNKIIREARVLTGPKPGLTRDAVEVKWMFNGRKITLIDTAGIRKVAKRDNTNQIENLAVKDSYRAISFAQVVALVVDVSEGKLVHLDLTIAQKALEEGRALILVANKCDLIKNEEIEIERIQQELNESLSQVRNVPIIPISALHNVGIRKLLPEVVVAFHRWDTRISTGILNRWLKALDRHHPPPTVNGKNLKIKYMTQVSTRPPTFALFSNKPTEFPETYNKYLLSQLKEEFNLNGIPSRLLLRGGTNPYKTIKKRKNVKKNSSFYPKYINDNNKSSYKIIKEENKTIPSNRSKKNIYNKNEKGNMKQNSNNKNNKINMNKNRKNNNKKIMHKNVLSKRRLRRRKDTKYKK